VNRLFGTNLKLLFCKPTHVFMSLT
jgi:hypothetical protein